jgi:hypothetical protein
MQGWRSVVKKEAAAARERPQGSFGTQRNTIDGVNVYVFAVVDYLSLSTASQTLINI